MGRVSTMIKLNHVALSVKNIEVSRKFYEQVFDLQFQKEGEGERPELGVRFILLADEQGNAVELFESKKQIPLEENLMDFSRHGIKHVAFTVDNIEETLEKALAEGAKVIWPVREIRGIIKRLAFIGDSDGIPIELMELR